MPFKRYVEIGRVALVNYGEDYGKLVVIVDVLDQNRVMLTTPSFLLAFTCIFSVCYLRKNREILSTYSSLLKSSFFFYFLFSFVLGWICFCCSLSYFHVFVSLKIKTLPCCPLLYFHVFIRCVLVICYNKMLGFVVVSKVEKLILFC